MPTHATFDAIVAGHLCLDIIPEIPPGSEAGSAALVSLMTPGKLSTVGPAALSTGGAVSNTGLALHKLGIATRLLGKVGGDQFGAAITHIVAAHGAGLTDGIVIDPAAASAYTVVINVPGVDRILLSHISINDTFTSDMVSDDLAAQARLFHFGYPPLSRPMYEGGGRNLAEMFRRVKAAGPAGAARQGGCTTSLDLSLPDPASDAGRADWPTVLRAALPWVDICAPSIDELLFMLRRPDYDRMKAVGAGSPSPGSPSPGAIPITPGLLAGLAEQLMTWGAKIVLIKLGERGVYLRTADRAALSALGRGRPADPAAWADRELWAPAFEVGVVGATGAGDAAIAGFLAGLLRGLGPEDALTAAAAVGACNVEAADALSGIRTWDETWARITAGWPRREKGTPPGD